jgi:hypothetical protein
MEVLQHRPIHPIVGNPMQVDDGGDVDVPFMTIASSISVNSNCSTQ